MNLSFYNGALGARMQQEKLNVIANNVANVNTEGFKAKNAVFSSLIQMNLNAPENPNTNLKAGAGVKLEKTDTNMANGGLLETDQPLHFAIQGQGLFGVRNPQDNSVSYTRNGSFISSNNQDGNFYLATSDGHLVLGKDNNPIKLFGSEEEDLEDDDLADLPLEEQIAVYKFDNYNDMVSLANNRFMPIEKNGTPSIEDQIQLIGGALESSNVDFAQEMARMIETQRAYQYALRMVTTSDEIEGTINSLRG